MKSRWRRVAVGIAAAVCLALGAAIAAFVAGVSLDASRLRDAASQRASAALGRPVSVQGALQLTLGRELVLRIGDVRILNPPGFGAPQFAAIGEARVRVDLFDALRGRLRLRSIEASDIGLWLERASDGRGNWSFSLPQGPASRQAAIDVGHVQLRRLAVQYHDARSAIRRSLQLDELSGTLRPNDPMRLALLGRMDNQTPFQLRIEAASLHALRQASAPWPFTFELKSCGAWLHADGMLDARQGEARFHLGAGADDLARAGRELGARLPSFGAATLSGHVVASADEIAVTQVQGLIGDAEVSGQLALSLAAVRPRLSGALSLTAFDLRPFLAADVQPPGDTPAAAQAWMARSLRDLVPADLALDLSVGRWLGLPVDIKDTKLALHADLGGVRAPLSATLAGAAVSGHLDLDLAAPTPTLALVLDAQQLALGTLTWDLPELQRLEGTLGRVGLRLGGRGDTLSAVLGGIGLSLEATLGKLSYRPAVDARPIAVTIDALQLDARPGQQLRGQARGSLLGERARLSIRAGMLPDLLRERATPLDLELALAQATLRLQALLGPAETIGGADVRFDLQARRSGDLARWLPLAPQSNLPVGLRGRVRIAPDAWRLDQTTLELGRSRLLIDARHSRSTGRPLTTAAVRSPLIDGPELATLRASAAAPAAAPTAVGARLDAPLLVDAIDLADADLTLDLQHVWLGRTELVDVGIVARTRDGRLLPSTAKGTLTGAPFTARVELDPSGATPSAKLDLSTGAIDIGALLRGLGVAEDIDGRADSLQLALQGRGNSLRELAANTAFEAAVAGGSLTLLGPAQRPVTEIRVSQALIGAAAGQPLRMSLRGTLDQTAVRIQLSTGSFADFAGDATRLPLSMTAQAADTSLSLDGQVTLPLGSAAQLSFEMGGRRLDSLSELARVELPAWGPWSLRGPIRMTPTGYELQGLTIEVGQSRLGGSGTLDLSGPRPRLQLQVAAPSLQLDDFPMPQHLAEAPVPPVPLDGLRGVASRLAGRVDRLLSARFLKRFDASVDVQASEVLSGVDRLADGALRLTLQDGRLELNPAVLNLPGGGLRLSMAYDLKESEVDFQVTAYVERFDYGIIARRLNRSDDLRGLFSLNLEMSGQAPSLDSIMRNAHGKLDFAVWPTELRSGMFNLWSANLVLTLLPLIDPGLKSQINCIVGRFDLKDGDLSDDKILIDTSTVRIRGAGHANLRTEEFAFVFRPRAKGPGLFRLQTPLRASGTLSDQRLGFEPQDVVTSMLRMVASPILLPIEWFRLGPMQRDGADVCTDPLRTAAR